MIVVTGGSGVLGTALVAALRGRGDEVVVLGSKQVDLREAELTFDAISDAKPQLVYHLAARVHGLGGNSAFPAEMFTDNVRINTNVIDAAHRCGVGKIVAVSTVACYSSDAPRPIVEQSIWDGPPHRSEAAYGHAKRAMLAQLEAYAAQYGLRYAYPLMTNLYGPRDRFDPVHGHVVPSLIAKFFAAQRQGGAVQIWGTGRAERDFLYADDAAQALIAIADRGEGPINCATGSTVAIRAVVDALIALTGVNDVAWDTAKPDGQLGRSYDVARLRATGFVPRISLEEGLRRTFDWYADHYPDVRS